MNTFVVIAVFAFIIIAIGVRSVIGGMRVRRELQRMFALLAARACPACGECYGQDVAKQSRALLGPEDPDPAAGGVVWEITCPRCRHAIRMLHGLDESLTLWSSGH